MSTTTQIIGFPDLSCVHVDLRWCTVGGLSVTIAGVPGDSVVTDSYGNEFHYVADSVALWAYDTDGVPWSQLINLDVDSLMEADGHYLYLFWRCSMYGNPFPQGYYVGSQLVDFSTPTGFRAISSTIEYEAVYDAVRGDEVFNITFDYTLGTDLDIPDSDTTAIAYAFASGVPTTSQDPVDPYDIWFAADPGYAYAFAYGSKAGGVDYLSTATAGAIASGKAIWGTAIVSETGTAYALAYGDLLLEHVKSNWVMWSQIGYMNFTIWKDNVAGERPMDWKGWVYAIKKIGSRVAVYGSNGVSFLIPSGTAWGLQTIYRIGLKSKNAVAGDDGIHFFIDNKNQLFALADGLQKLDYSEYLADLTSPVLSYDIESGFLYICDGTYGFVYNHADKSMGKGPINITGIYPQGGTLYAVSPATIITPRFRMCTDIYDCGTRRAKTIYSLDIGTDAEAPIEAAIDYRLDKASDFIQTSWYTVDRRGRVHITAFGREFRFRFKNLEYEYFEPDYITINGEVHAH